jgi:hypothetical protein
MSDEDLMKIRNFGEKSLEELREKLTLRGISGQAGSGEAAGIENLSAEDIGELMGGDAPVALAEAAGAGLYTDDSALPDGNEADEEENAEGLEDGPGDEPGDEEEDLD